MRIRFSARARRELDGIFQYLVAQNPAAARATVERIEEVARALDQHPSLGHRTRIPGVRILTVPRLPYRISYNVGANAITVLTVRHTSRRPIRGLQ